MKKQCKDCDGYEKKGHNHCRMCGFHLRKNSMPRVRKATAYNIREKFCGFCGGEKHNCGCY